MEARLQQLEEAHTRKRSRQGWEEDSEDECDSIDMDELSGLDSEEDVAPPLEVGIICHVISM